MVETATDPKTIPHAVFQKRVGGKNEADQQKNTAIVASKVIVILAFH